jgi:hypothetical protein
MAVHSTESILEALNRAADDINDAADLPDSGTRDALNLLVNAASTYLAHPKADLDQVADECYSAPLSEIIGWINGG